MKWYPIIQTIIQSVTTINRVYGLIVKKNNFVLMILHAIFDSSQGIFIIIVFLFIPENRNNLRVCCSKLLSKHNHNEIIEEDLIFNNGQSFTASNSSLYLRSEYSANYDKNNQNL